MQRLLVRLSRSSRLPFVEEHESPRGPLRSGSGRRFVPVALGFTLVELLVVIAIIGILVSMTIPSVQVVRELARKAACQNNMRNIVLAIQNYESQLRVYPPGRVGCDCGSSQYERKCREGDSTTVTPEQRTGSSGFLMLLPQLDEKLLYDSFNRFRNGAVFPGGDEQTPGSQSCAGGSTSGWELTISGNTTTLQTRLQVLICPSSHTIDNFQGEAKFEAATGCYAFCMGTLGPNAAKTDSDMVKYRNNGVFMYHVALSSRDVQDGLGNTIFIGEVDNADMSGSQNRWMVGSMFLDSLRCTESACGSGDSWEYPLAGGAGGAQAGEAGQKERVKVTGQCGSPQRNGVNFGFGDGRVLFLTDEVDAELLKNLSTRSANLSSNITILKDRLYRETHNLNF